MKPVPSADPPYPEPRFITTNFLPSSGRRGLSIPSSGVPAGFWLHHPPGGGACRRGGSAPGGTES